MVYVTIYSCMMEEIRTPIHKKNSSTKHILNTYRDAQKEIYYN